MRMQCLPDCCQHMLRAAATSDRRYSTPMIKPAATKKSMTATIR